MATFDPLIASSGVVVAVALGSSSFLDSCADVAAQNNLFALLDWSLVLLSLVLCMVIVVDYLCDGIFGLYHPKTHLLMFLGLAIPGLSLGFSTLSSLWNTTTPYLFNEGYYTTAVTLSLFVSAIGFQMQHPSAGDLEVVDAVASKLLLFISSLLLLLEGHYTYSGHQIFGHARNFSAGSRTFYTFPVFEKYDAAVVVALALQVFLSFRRNTTTPHSSNQTYLWSVCAYTVASFLSPFSVLWLRFFIMLGSLYAVAGLTRDVVTKFQKATADRDELAQTTAQLRVQLQKQTEETNVKEKALKAKSSFLVGLANELKNVAYGTSVVVGLLYDTDVQPNQSAFIGKLEKSIEHVNNVVKEALFYSEIDAQKPSEGVTFRIEALLEEVISSVSLRAHLDERDVDMVYTIDAAVSGALIADYSRLKNILLRLLTNAAKATAQGEIIISVKAVERILPNVLSEEDQVMVAISVSDTGIGIAPDHLPGLFEPFALTSQQKREEVNLGLGLAVCSLLAKLCGGKLNVKSELTKGTTITLTCPFKLTSAVAQMPIIGSLQRWGNGRIVAVIDDNPKIAAVVRMHLEPTGVEVLHYSSPQEAINQVKDRIAAGGKSWDVVFVDYIIAGSTLDGAEVVRSIQSESSLKNVSIVVMCNAKQRKSIVLHGCHFLYKPLKKDQVVTLTQMLCSTTKVEEGRLLANLATTSSDALINPRSPMVEPEQQHVTLSALSSSSSSTATSTPVKNLSVRVSTGRDSPSTQHLIVNPLVEPELTPATPPREAHHHEKHLEKEKSFIGSPPETSGDSTTHEAPKAAPPRVAKKEMILLVEDNPINARIASAVLRRHAYEVELAGNGLLAFERLKVAHDNFNLILMDIHMPVMDGLTSTKLVRQFEMDHKLDKLPIIALTSDEESKTVCLEAGCSDHMVKPLDYPQLIEVLRKLRPTSS